MRHTLHARETLAEFMGTVVERQRRGTFKVRINDTDRVVPARIAGRMARYHIKLSASDDVLIELPIGTLDRGRITCQIRDLAATPVTADKVARFRRRLRANERLGDHS